MSLKTAMVTVSQLGTRYTHPRPPAIKLQTKLRLSVTNFLVSMHIPSNKTMHN